MNFWSWKDRKAVTATLRKVHAAEMAEAARTVGEGLTAVNQFARTVENRFKPIPG